MALHIPCKPSNTPMTKNGSSRYCYVSSPVDCKSEKDTRWEGACNATCGARGKRTVRLIPVVLKQAKYGGEECKEKVEEEECTEECSQTTTIGRQKQVFCFLSRPSRVGLYSFFIPIPTTLFQNKSFKLHGIFPATNCLSLFVCSHCHSHHWGCCDWDHCLPGLEEAEEKQGTGH